MKEFFPRRLDGRQFLGCAFRKTHLFARHEEHLSDRHVVCAVYTFSWLEHVSEFGLVRVPVRLHTHDQHWSNRPLDHIEYCCVDGIPAGRRLEVGCATQ